MVMREAQRFPGRFSEAFPRLIGLQEMFSGSKN
jgi:hypothetical protein